MRPAAQTEVPRRCISTAGAKETPQLNWRFLVSILAQIIRRRVTVAPALMVVEVDDLTALAVAVGVMTAPTDQAA